MAIYTVSFDLRMVSFSVSEATGGRVMMGAYYGSNAIANRGAFAELRYVPFPDRYQIYVDFAAYIQDFTLGTWYNFKFELQEDAGGIIERFYLDNILKRTATDTAITTIGCVSPRTSGEYNGITGTFSLNSEHDNFSFLVDGSAYTSDDFGDGVLTPPWTLTGTLTNAETGGVWEIDSSGEGLSFAQILQLFPLGGAIKSDMKKHPITGAKAHVYNDSGTIKLQWFEPGSTSPDYTIDVLTGQGTLSPSIEWEDDGRLRLCLSDGTTRKESATPWVAASWVNWTA